MAKSATGQTPVDGDTIFGEVRAVLKVLVEECGCSPTKAISSLRHVTLTVFEARRKEALYDNSLVDRALMVKSGAAGQFLRPGESLSLSDILGVDAKYDQEDERAPGGGCCGGE